MNTKTVTQIELRRNNGDGMSRKWVAVGGIVYDVTDCPRWKKEMHEFLHFPGQELSDELDNAPHTDSVFRHECVKVVGKLANDGEKNI